MSQKDYLVRKLTDQEIDNLPVGIMKEILREASKIKESEQGEAHIRKLSSNTIGILSMCGKAGLTDLIPELWSLTEHWNEYFREDAVSTLSCRFSVPEFKEKCHQIFLEDESETVRFRALGGWISYYYDTQDPNILEEMYKILISDYYDNSTKKRALRGMFNIVGARPPCDIYSNNMDWREEISETQEEFNARIPWEEVTALLKKYAPRALKNYPEKKTSEEKEKEKKESIQLALKLLADKFEFDDYSICSITKLSMEEVLKLKKDGTLE